MAGTQDNAQRKRPMVTVTLSPEALALLDGLAARAGATRSATVERLVREASRGT